MAFNIELKKQHKCVNEDGSTTTVTIRLQVHCNVINWYFNCGETTQEFRDVLYGLAARAHKDMPDACDGYYRGSDSLHIKRHHTNYAEAKFKHNHYRFLSGDVTPDRLRAHLYGVIKYGMAIGEEYLTYDEADEIVAKYESNYEYERTPSKYAPYQTPHDQVMQCSLFRMTGSDIRELEENQDKEEPCKDASRPIEFGMRALNRNSL